MEKGQEQNGGENNPNKTKEDHTHDTSDLDNNESDKKGELDGTKTKKETFQEAQKPNEEAQGATDLSNKRENTNASEFGEITGPGPGVPGTTQGAQSGMVPSAEYGGEQRSDSLKAEEKEGVAGTTQGAQSGMVPSAECGIEERSDSLKEEANEGVPGTTHGEQSGMVPSAEPSIEQKSASSKEEAKKGVPGTTPGAHSRMVPPAETDVEQKSDSSKEEAKEEVQKLNDESQDDTSNITSEKTGNTIASGSGGTGSSSEEMKTGSGANKDDDKEGQPKKKKAKGEGVAGEGGITHAVKTEQYVIKQRSVSISLCTSAYSFNVEGLVSYLKGLKKEYPKLIKAVKVHELPYNDLDHYRFDEKDPVDVMILCHSINNRRFAITDVMDALYDEYLPYCARVIGKEKMGVIVHDFDDMRETVQSSRMSSFKYKQPKAFETTSLQITCGHIEKEEQVRKQMLHADREKIVEFLEYASKYPEEMQKEESKWSLKRFFPDFKIPSFASFGLSGRENEGQIEESIALRSMGSNTHTAEHVQKNQDSSNDGTSVDPQPAKGNKEPDPPRDAIPAKQQSLGGVHATATPGTQVSIDLPSQQKKTQNSGKGFTSVPQSPSRTPRRISVSVCSSAYQHNVKGLLSWFAKFQAEQSHMITDVRFRQLPYNDIDSFKFPPNNPVDVMILCHSVDNRGFSITNVVNAIYEKYLKYCNKLIGKKKLAVIVHDFADCKPAIVEGRMESFRRMQPLTFELVGTVIVCGRLEDPAKLGIREEDLTRLMCFLELARFET